MYQSFIDVKEEHFRICFVPYLDYLGLRIRHENWFYQFVLTALVFNQMEVLNALDCLLEVLSVQIRHIRLLLLTFINVLFNNLFL